MKQQFYLGKAAIAIHIRAYKKKIYSKLYQLENVEKQQQAKQAQSYTSTVSHELRTPLGSILFFVKQI